MDVLPASSRLLFDPGFESWGHSFGGYMTDYAILTTCFTLLFASWSKLGCSTSQGTQLIAYLLIQGLAFGLGGVAHHMLDIYFNDGETMGRSWGDENSGWMYPWLFAMVLSSLNGGATPSVAFFFTDLPSWMGIVTYVLGVSLAGYEFYIFVFTAEGINTTGTYLGYFSMLGTLTAFIAFVVSFCKKCSNGGRYGPTLQCCIGMTLQMCGLVVLMTAPASCKKVGEERAGCPYPAAFNQNAVFHSFTVVGVIALVTGCWKLSEKADFALLPTQ